MLATDLIVEQLAAHRTLASAPREELEWIAAHCKTRNLKVGEVLSSRQRPVEGLHIVLKGLITLHVDRGAGNRRVMEWRAGDVTGVLPYSRVQNPPGDAVVEEAAEVITVVREFLPDLVRSCYHVTALLVHVMTDRARQFTASEQQDEKTISLGKLAAGLAHELNNPASAAARSAVRLIETLEASEAAARAIARSHPTDAQFDALEALRGASLETRAGDALSAVDLADREDAFTDWLDLHGCDSALAGPLAATPIATGDLDRLSAVFSGDTLRAAATWVASGCTARSLARVVETATTRIHDLVTAMKAFTYMDRGSVLESVDIAKGLRDTVVVLEGKAHQKNVTVTIDAEPDLPTLYAFGGEINQIWEKLIDNAIDASPAGGTVCVSARRRDSTIRVTVVDNGPGIPAAVQPRIFDPFFTTKPMGHGIGLGLDIARRIVRWHSGEINFSSQKDRTEFIVSLPLSGRKTG